MKICFVTTGDINNIATAKRALGMANPLTELGWEVHILMENVEGNRKRVAMECNSKVQLHYFNSGSAINEIRSKNRIVRQIQADYIYLCAFVFRNLVFINNKKTIKLVEHPELQSGIPDIKGLKHIWVWLIEYYSVIYSDGLLCASKYLETIYQYKSKIVFKNTPIHYFPYAFSKSLYRLKNKADLSDHFIKLMNKKNFVFLGSITRNYGVFTMIEAFENLTKEQKDIRLILLGKGRHYQQAIDYVKDNKLDEFVYLPGFIEEEDISNYFSIADFFISPMNDTVQDWARCPSKLYMYLPFKRPIITCKIGEPHQVLAEKGYYFTPGSSGSLAEVISKELKMNNQPKYVNPELHTWEHQSKDFDMWINQNFN